MQTLMVIETICIIIHVAYIIFMFVLKLFLKLAMDLNFVVLMIIVYISTTFVTEKTIVEITLMKGDVVCSE